MSRFSQAIAEGDGISVVPFVDGDVAALASAAENAGAEAIAVATTADVARVRAAVALPVLVREPLRSRRDLEAARAVDADACVLVFDDLEREGELLEDLHAEALDLGFAVALEVRDEEELERTLERVDPDIFVISCRSADADEREDLERTLDLLPDVPAGKLVISEGRIAAREQVLALERAGVDAIILSDLARSPDFALALEELVRGPGATL